MSETDGRRVDPLALAGLLTGLLSVAFCLGVLSPLALGLSIAAQRRRPSPVALAGIGFGVGGLALLALSIVGATLFLPVLREQRELESDAALLQRALADAEARSGSGRAPAWSDILVEERALIDPWGAPYLLDVERNGALPVATSAGPDGVQGTPDDAVIHFERSRAYAPMILWRATPFR